ncbi:hypothetical protein Aperf_G00000050365 [Anoplocephala perfoliata]
MVVKGNSSGSTDALESKAKGGAVAATTTIVATVVPPTLPSGSVSVRSAIAAFTATTATDLSFLPSSAVLPLPLKATAKTKPAGYNAGDGQLSAPVGDPGWIGGSKQHLIDSTRVPTTKWPVKYSAAIAAQRSTSPALPATAAMSVQILTILLPPRHLARVKFACATGDILTAS